MDNTEFINQLDKEFTLDSLADLMQATSQLVQTDPKQALERYEAIGFHLFKQQN